MFSISNDRRKTHSTGLWCRVALLALVLVTVAMGFAGTAQAGSSKYALHNQNLNWMEYLPDTMQISQINIPGTHDSGTFGVAAAMAAGAKAQYDSIPDQLNAGIRFFDIRLFLNRNITSSTDEEDLGLSHGPSTCYTTEHGWTVLTLEHVFTYASDFVKNHPSEVVILEIRKESAAFYEEQIMERINRIMVNYHHGHKNTKWSRIQCYNKGETVPTLGQVRGKVIVINENQDGPGTYYEDNYEWYDPYNISPKVKSEFIKSHLENYTYAQEYFSTEDKFVDTRVRNKKGVKPNSIKSPMFINTNLTQIEPSTFYKKGPYGCWYPLYHGDWIGDYTPLKNMNLNVKTGYSNQRTGWWRFDFPQDQQVTEIIESNYIYLKEYQIFIRDIDKDFKASDVSVDVVLSNGYHLQPVKTSFRDGGYMIDFGYYPDTVELKDIQVKSNNPAKGIYFENNYIYKNGHKGLEYFPISESRKDNYRMGNLNGTQKKDVYVTFEDAAHPEYRPGQSPEEILNKIGDLSFYWNEGKSGRRYMQVSKPGSEAGQLTSVKLGTNVPDTYVMTVTLPMFTGDGTRIEPVFNSFAFIRDDCPYMIKKFEGNRVTLKLKSTEAKEWVELPMAWLDGKDLYGYRKGQMNKLLSSAVKVRHKAYDRKTGELVVDEYLQGGGKNPVLKFNGNDKLEAYVKAYGSDFRPLRHYFEFSSDAEYMNYRIKSTPETYLTQRIELIWTAQVDIYFNWKDNSNADKARPDTVPIMIRDNDSGIVISDEIGSKNRVTTNQWSKTIYCQFFSDESDSPKKLDFKNITYDVSVENYKVDSVTCSYGKTSLPVYALSIACSYQKPIEYEDIHGSITWYDINDSISHRDLNPAITVYRNDEAMTLEHSVLHLDTERTSYYYEPDSDFPLLSQDRKTEYVYAIEPQPVPGYLVLRPEKFDITYIRAISMSGTVEWFGKRPVANEPVVTLRDQNGTMIDQCTCKDGTYLFENLPIATEAGKRCEYHVEVTVPGYDDCIVNYGPVEQDGATGNITQDALLLASEQPANAEIPVKLILNGIDNIKDVTEEFSFVLTCDDDPYFDKQYVTLDASNSFSDSFRIENITDSRKLTYTVKQINLWYSPEWIYDDSIKTVTVGLRFIDGKPVAEVDMGGDTAVTFTNTYTGDIEKKDITVKVQWLDAEKYERDIPDSVEIKLFGNGTALKTAEVSAADGWTCVFTDLPTHEVIPSNDGTRRLVEIRYSVDGSDVTDFVRTVDEAETDQYLLTYKANPDLTTVDIDVNLEWVFIDMLSKDPDKPADVTVTLYADGQVYRTEKASATGNWACTFRDVPVKDIETGKRISYAVDAEDVNGFTYTVSTAGSNAFTVTYRAKVNIETTDITVRVEWIEPDMANASQIPESVSVTLYADSQVKYTDEVGEEQDWTRVYNDMPVNHPATGAPLTYSVDGENVQGYTRSVRTEGTNSFVISYYAKPDIKTTDVNVRVEWFDPDMAQLQGATPDAVTVTLYKDGEAEDTAKVTSSGNWAYAFKDLPVNHPATGMPLTYAVDAEDVQGFTRAVRTEGTNNFVISYYAKPEVKTTDVNVRVEWFDPDMAKLQGAMPEAVAVTLYKNGQATDSAKATASDSWALTFKDLPVNHPATGEPLTYAVDGEDVQGYTRSVRTEGTNSFVISYYAKPDLKTTDVNVRVEWFDPDMAKLQGAMPDAVTVTLYKDGAADDSAKVTASGNWAYTFKDLPVNHPATGEPLTYAVDSENVQGYTRTVRTEGTNSFVITYYAQPEVKTTDINVRVEWFDPDMTKAEGATPAAVTVTLYRNGLASGTVKVTESDDWAYTFKDQPVNHPATGDPLTYAVDGEDIEGYTRTVRSEGSYGFVISYYAAPDVKTKDIGIRVEWIDPDMLKSTQKPASVNVILYADGVQKASAPVSATNDWSFVFKNMPVNNPATGATVAYSADGSDVPGYNRTVRTEGTDRYVVTYYAVPDVKTTDISVRVEWIYPDMDMAAKIPNHISVTLYADQQMNSIANTDAAGNWFCIFRDKPVNNPATGMPVTYTVLGTQVEGFSQEVRSEGTYGFVITYRAGKTEYHIIQGAHQTITTIDDTATFASDAPYSKFESVIVDGVKVDKQYYTSHSGSTVVVFNKKFIKTLKPGKHQLTIVSFDGSASTDFNVIKMTPTGDGTDLALLTVLLLASASVLVLCLRKRKA
ncbi:MAG: Cna B-type domain-containing protein [Clostridia bacterium]|nr:Cna B-type domain-containing protein [Clostridia bacterium]